MKIILGNQPKSDIVFFKDTILEQLVINSPKYKLDIYRNMEWEESAPWKVNIAGVTAKKDRKPLDPKSISKHIFIKPHFSNHLAFPIERLENFLKDLYEDYQIIGEI